VRHADASTSTTTLPTALDVMKNSDPSIGYSTAYPFGVIVPILCIYLMTRQVQPNSRRNGKVSAWPRRH
jgi:putative transport protein